MLRRSAAAAAAAAALALGAGPACASAGAGRLAGADLRFVARVHQTVTDIAQYRTDVQLLKLGRATCDDLRAHAGLQQIADALEATGSPRLPPQEVGAIMANAVNALCPAFSGRISPVGTGA